MEITSTNQINMCIKVCHSKALNVERAKWISVEEVMFKSLNYYHRISIAMAIEIYDSS